MSSKKSVRARTAGPKAIATASRRRAAGRTVGDGTAAGSNAELDAIYATFLQQPAQLTREQMNAIERRIRTGDAEWRQLALASLTKTGVELKQRFAATREAAQLAAELLTVAEDMGKRLRQLAGMLETASTRLMLSLCERPDMHELIATARARMRSDEGADASDPDPDADSE